MQQLERGVLIVDDHRSFAEALAIAIDTEPGLRCAAIAASAAEGLDAAVRARPDLALVDMRLPDASGADLAGRLQHVRPGMPVLALTAHVDAGSVAAAAQAGVCAFLRKECSVRDIVATLRTATDRPLVIDTDTLRSTLAPPAPPVPVAAGADGVTLTRREHEVLDLLAQAHDVQRIARRLGISVHTTRGYVKSLLAKLEVHTQLEAVVRARRLGLVVDPAPEPTAAAGAEPVRHLHPLPSYSLA